MCCTIIITLEYFNYRQRSAAIVQALWILWYPTHTAEEVGRKTKAIPVTRWESIAPIDSYQFVHWLLLCISLIYGTINTVYQVQRILYILWVRSSASILQYVQKKNNHTSAETLPIKLETTDTERIPLKPAEPSIIWDRLVRFTTIIFCKKGKKKRKKKVTSVYLYISVKNGRFHKLPEISQN